VGALLPQLTGLFGMITGGASGEQPNAPQRARGPVLLPRLTPEEHERMMAGIIADEPQVATVIPIQRSPAEPPEKPLGAG
jgi:hypothetical protein